MTRVWLAVLLLVAGSGLAIAQAPRDGRSRATLPAFELTRPSEVSQWVALHDVGPLEHTPDGMRITITGGDPYITGPARDFPAGVTLWLVARVRSAQPGVAQVFYWGPGQRPVEERAVRFPVSGNNEWTTARVPMPALGPGSQIRFDPPGTEADCTLAWLRFERRVQPVEPRWPRPTVAPTRGGPSITSGEVVFRHAPRALGAFTLDVAGRRMAAGHNRPTIGYVSRRGELEWLDLNGAGRTTVRAVGRSVEARCAAKDRDGVTWTITQAFQPSRVPGAIDASVTVAVSARRQAYYVPLLVTLPGLGSFGGKRERGLFAGLEYLDAPDKSSSNADIEGPGSDRRVPDTAKITLPLMTMQAGGRWVSLRWQPARDLSAVYDTPDRMFRSGANVMGVIFPGSDGLLRPEGHRLPYTPSTIQPRGPLTCKATLIGGRGESVVESVQRYVRLAGLPPLPRMPVTPDGFTALMAHGWLESGVRVDDQFRHAWWPGSSFGPTDAADGPIYMAWLAARTGDAGLASRLAAQAERSVARVPPGSRAAASVSHVTTPAPALVYGDVAACVRTVTMGARDSLRRFNLDGTIDYEPGKMDFGRTHFERHANGLTAPVVTGILRACALAGDQDLLVHGVRLLDQLDRYRNCAPRGAQTWEVPLHTPDILASAHLVYAHVLGFELTGERKYLDRAIHWAWTGVPFVYLYNPTGNAVGPYATIPVFGSTHWTAVNWMGLPVQWCGLVYSDALYRLARYDTSGPWRRLADGITISGVQQSWPIEGKDLGGLLPDSYVLRARVRNPVAINPGTVQANAVQMYGQPLYDYYIARPLGLRVHVPGALRDVAVTGRTLTFGTRSWLKRPYYVLVAGVRGMPAVRIDGAPAVLGGEHAWHQEEGLLVLRVEGDRTVEVTVP